MFVLGMHSDLVLQLEPHSIIQINSLGPSFSVILCISRFSIQRDQEGRTLLCSTQNPQQC
jgi:hypothetical protein